MEKNILKKNVHVCINESICCIAEINTTLQINYTSVKNCTMRKTNYIHLVGSQEIWFFQ